MTKIISIRKSRHLTLFDCIDYNNIKIHEQKINYLQKKIIIIYLYVKFKLRVHIYELFYAVI